jgi:hypothetical protein
LRLCGTVDQRAVRIGEQFIPVCIQRHGVKRRAACHGKHFPGLVIQKHNGTLVPFQLLIGPFLQTIVDRKHQIVSLARRGNQVFQLPEGFLRVHIQKRIIIRKLQSGFPVRHMIVADHMRIQDRIQILPYIVALFILIARGKQNAVFVVYIAAHHGVFIDREPLIIRVHRNLVGLKNLKIRHIHNQQHKKHADGCHQADGSFCFH